MAFSIKKSVLCVLPLLLVAASALAHFAMIVPEPDVVGKDHSKELGILIEFTHPLEGGSLMQMDKPRKFGVVSRGTVQDLLGTLREKKVDGKDKSIESAR